jgi:carbon monoxide dehydrogenase subunit G
VTLTVRRAGNLTGPSSVTLSTADGTATAGQDYTAQVAVPVAFAAGQAAATVKIPILGDLVDEPDEQFTVTISGTGVIAPSSAIVTIADNDVAGTLQFQAAEWSVSEWKGFVEVTVTRTKGTAAGASVHYATVPGTATAIDYSPTSGTLIFAAGEMSKTIMVSVTGDGTSEGAESFGVVLSSPSFGVVLGAPSTTTVWIVDEN